MRYIKLYEGFEVYHELDYITYMESKNMPFDIITKIEYDNIMSCLSGFKEIRQGTDLNQGSISIMFGTGRISIRRVRDDWFYVFIASSDPYYYKCDQMEGLLQLFRDKL